ncbi:MAG: transporter substrate-binding domain-containing protein [Clostridia bacterium]|nr:transporter substrate-binding domain-containing protein [Clostridia bacterium]
MKFTKILAALLAAAMCLFAMASCTSTPAENNDGKLTLKIATNAEFEPFEFLDADGNIIGFDVDLIKAISENQNMNFEFSDMKFESVLASVSSGKCDAGLSGLTINDKRKQAVDFTDPYYIVGQVLIVKADDTVFTGTDAAAIVEQLKGKTVGACNGYTGKAFIEGDEDFGYTAIEGLTSVGYDSAAVGINDLKNGKLAAFILDDAVAEKLVAADDNQGQVKIIPIVLTEEHYAIAVEKGNTELLSKLNAGLKAIKDNGTLDQLISDWDL